MTLLHLVFLLPLFGVLAILFGTAARWSALVSCLLQFVVVLLVAGNYLFDSLTSSKEFLYESSIPALSSLGISLSTGVNGLSVLLLLLTALVSVAAVLMDSEATGSKARMLATLFMSAGAAGAFVSTDLFFFFAFHELALIPTFLLIATQGRGAQRLRIAWRATIFLAVGSLVLLAGLIGTASALSPTGQLSFHLPTLMQSPQVLSWGSVGSVELLRIPALLLLLGFGTLVSLFPLHSWAAPAYASAPAPVAMMHAGVLKKFGIYGLLQIGLTLMPAAIGSWAKLLLVLLLGNILIIGLVSIASKRVDTLLANSSVMHMGYLFLGIVCASVLTGTARDAAYAGVVLLTVAHGLSIALGFGLTGSLQARTGKLEIAALGGLAKRMPRFTLLFGCALFAGIGLPGLANFCGEFLIFLSGFGALQELIAASEQKGRAFADVHVWIVTTTLLSVIGVLLSAVYALRLIRRCFHEGSAQVQQDEPLLSASQWLAASVLAFLLVLLGFFPQLVLQFLGTAY